MRGLLAVPAVALLTACQLPKPAVDFAEMYIYSEGRHPVLGWDETDIVEAGEWCGPNCAAFDQFVLIWPTDRTVGSSRRVGEVEVTVVAAYVQDGRETVTIRGRTPIDEFEYTMSDCREPVQVDWLSPNGRFTRGLDAEGAFRDCTSTEP